MRIEPTISGQLVTDKMCRFCLQNKPYSEEFIKKKLM